jgi:hypothetical protein
MRLLRAIGAVVGLAFCASCKLPGNARSADSSDVAQSNSGAAASSSTQQLPTECKQQGKFCVPPGDFVEAWCGNKYPGLAIVWFGKGTPWVRRYVKLPVVEPRNTTGGPSSDTKLTWGEEVLVLKQHGAGGTVIVSGAVDYDVLRWDGTCASMSDLEMTASAPSMPKNAPIVWKYLDTNIQEALRKDATIQKAVEAEGKACGGKAAGAGFACERASRNLSSAIVAAVRKGIALPTPERLP